MVAAEHKGWGNTVSEIDVSKASAFSKTKFSMVTPEVEALLLEHQDRNSVVLMGIMVCGAVLVGGVGCLGGGGGGGE